MNDTYNFKYTTTTTTGASTEKEEDYPLFAYEAREINFSIAKGQGCSVINKEINKAAKRGETFVCINIKDNPEFENKLSIKKHFEDREFKVLMSNEWLVISWEEEKRDYNNNNNTITLPYHPPTEIRPFYQEHKWPEHGPTPITCTYHNETNEREFYP